MQALQSGPRRRRTARAWALPSPQLNFNQQGTATRRIVQRCALQVNGLRNGGGSEPAMAATWLRMLATWQRSCVEHWHGRTLESQGPGTCVCFVRPGPPLLGLAFHGKGPAHNTMRHVTHAHTRTQGVQPSCPPVFLRQPSCPPILACHGDGCRHCHCGALEHPPLE